ncbi:peptidase C69 [bacterium SM23_57]|nr:MAG: peptidase C69 [bacterium SM23_57]
MKELTQIAVDRATSLGASYADIRIIETRAEDITIRNGEIADLEQVEDFGFGVRVIVDGAWGFASSHDVTKEEIERAAALAVEIARASASLKVKDIALAPEDTYQEKWQTPYVENPFKVSLEEKMNLLFQLDEILRKNSKIKVAESTLSFTNEHQYLRTSEGTYIDQDLMRSGGGYLVHAVNKHDMQTRSYPNSFRGQFMSLGYELIRGLPLLQNAERIREEAVALLSAKACPSGKKSLILDGSQLGLQIHESVGHATELDRVLGMEANYAGTSFATPEKLGNFTYGSPIVNLFCDSTIPGGLATIGYDDDGVRAQRWHLVKEGQFVGYQFNRELSHTIGKTRSSGNNRADGWNRIPIVRITNLSLEPGDWELDDMISDTDEGIYMETNKSWSIDQRRLNFQFGCEVGWEIKNGKKGDMVKNPTYQGITPEFWKSCDAIANQKHFTLWGVHNCGKGQPGQRAEMSHGAAPARFRHTEVGVAKG